MHPIARGLVRELQQRCRVDCHENAAWFSLNFLFIQVSLHSLTYCEVIANLLHSLPQFLFKRIAPSIGSEQEIDSQRYNYPKSRSQELYLSSIPLPNRETHPTITSPRSRDPHPRTSKSPTPRTSRLSRRRYSSRSSDPGRRDSPRHPHPSTVHTRGLEGFLASR